jgi:glutaredoxin
MTMPHLLVLTSEGCTPCLRVKRIVNELQAEFPDISIQEVEFTSAAGGELAIENNITYPPAVFLDGKLIGKGKIYSEQIVTAVQTRGARG